MSLAHGTRIGPFAIVRALGVGGMGETYVAEQVLPEGGTREVCLKVVRRDLAGDPRFSALFLDEARLHGRLEHENIVRLLAAGHEASGPYLALELVRGITLDQLLSSLLKTGRSLSVPLGALILRDLCRALAYAHGLAIDGTAQNLVHRDLSPSNVLLGADGAVKLTDFGIAKAHDQQHRTTAGVVRGKLAYLSPEQLRGEALDARSDLFALGIIAYEMFAGEHPFLGRGGPSDLLVVHHILTGQRRPLGERAPTLPGSLLSLTECLLSARREQRPTGAAEVEAVLSAHGVDEACREQLRALVEQTMAGASDDHEPTESHERHMESTAHQAFAAPATPASSAAPPGALPVAQAASVALAETVQIGTGKRALILAHDEHHVHALWQNFVILVWLRDTRAADVQSAWTSIRQLSGAHPEGVGLVQVIEENCNHLGNEARKVFSELYKAERSIQRSAIIIEAAGFRAASVRMIVAALARASGSIFPHRVFASVHSAASWQAEEFADAAERKPWGDALTQAIENARQFGRR